MELQSKFIVRNSDGRAVRGEATVTLTVQELSNIGIALERWSHSPFVAVNDIAVVERLRGTIHSILTPPADQVEEG